MKLTAVQLSEHLRKDFCFIEGKNKVEVLLGEINEVLVTVPIEAGESRNIMIDLIVDFKNAEEFIDRASIMTVDDLYRMKYSIFWSQYMQGLGYISCMLQLLNNADLCFRIEKSLTIIYSTDVHYYDEVEKAMTLPEHFINYIETMWPQLETYASLWENNGGFVKIG